ncbi:MAG: L,D-transpeptidase [Chloroflexota bacterium]
MKARSVFFIIVIGLLSSTVFAADQPQLFGLSNADILAYPVPEVNRLLPNDTLLSRRDYRQINGEVQLFDAPDGNLSADYPAGTYFVSVQQVANGWAQIDDGRWMRLGQLSPAPISHLGGVFLNGPTLYPFGWLRSNIQASAQPGTAPEGDVLPHYMLVNVFTSATIDGTLWYQIGLNRWVTSDLVAVINPPERPAEVDTERWAAVDVGAEIVYIYQGSTPVFAALTSTGVETSPTTTGLYHVYARYNTTVMSRGVRTDPWFYYMEDVPYTLYFNDHMALHGAYWHDEFGYVRSHGCVNLSLTDAYWVYSFLSEEIDLTNPADIWPAVYVYQS